MLILLSRKVPQEVHCGEIWAGLLQFSLRTWRWHVQSQDLLVLIFLTQRKLLIHSEPSCPHIAILELQPFVQRARRHTFLLAGKKLSHWRFKHSTTQGHERCGHLHLTRCSEGLVGILSALRSWIQLRYPGLWMWLWWWKRSPWMYQLPRTV